MRQGQTGGWLVSGALMVMVLSGGPLNSQKSDTGGTLEDGRYVATFSSASGEYRFSGVASVRTDSNLGGFVLCNDDNPRLRITFSRVNWVVRDGSGRPRRDSTPVPGEEYEVSHGGGTTSTDRGSISFLQDTETGVRSGSVVFTAVSEQVVEGTLRATGKVNSVPGQLEVHFRAHRRGPGGNDCG